MPIRLLVSLSFLLVPVVCQAQLPNPDYYTLFQNTGGSGDTRLIDSAGTVLQYMGVEYICTQWNGGLFAGGRIITKKWATWGRSCRSFFARFMEHCAACRE